MKEALVLIMLALLIVPLLVGVRRIRRLPGESKSHDVDEQTRTGTKSPD